MRSSRIPGFTATAVRLERMRRRGSALAMAVLGVATMLMLIAASTLDLTQSRLIAEDLLSDAAQARLGAISAIESAIQYCNSTPSWRTAMTHGSPADRMLANNKITFTLYDDSDSNLANRDTDPVRIAATAECGVAKQAMTATARALPLTCLNAAVHANNNMTVLAGGVITNNRPLSGGSNATVNGTVNGDVECVNTVSGSGSITGTIKNNVTPKEMPIVGTIAYYESLGSPLDYASLSNAGGSGKSMKELLVSPTRNPAGTANALGIYVINCGGGDLTIDSSRIVGTLIIKNPGSGSKVTNTVNWAPAVANYPTLIVEGSITIELTGAPLNEATAALPNYNPPDTPYQGASNTTSTDTYPCVIQGLIYQSGSLTLQGTTEIRGIVVCWGDVTVNGIVNVVYDSSYINNPPPRFVSHRLAVNPGSWRPD